MERINLKQALDYVTYGTEPTEKRFKINYPYSEVPAHILKQKQDNLIRDFECGAVKLYALSGAIFIHDTDEMDEHYLQITLKNNNQIKWPYNDWYDPENYKNNYEVGDKVENLYISKTVWPKGKPKEKKIKIKTKLVPYTLIKEYDYDWNRSIIAKNLKNAERNGEAFDITTEGYCFVEIDFSELKEKYTKSLAKTKQNERDNWVREQALNLPQNITSLSQAIKIITKEYQIKNQSGKTERGWGDATIRRILTQLTNDKIRIFKKKEGMGRNGKNLTYK